MGNGNPVEFEEVGQTLIVTRASWKVPSESRAFEGLLIGKLTAKQRRQRIEKAKAARAAWTPTEEGMRLVDRLNSFVGFSVQIQFWHPVMWLLDDEGPLPVIGDCVGIVFQKMETFLQPYAQLTNVCELSSRFNRSGMKYLMEDSETGYSLAPIAELYSISRIRPIKIIDHACRLRTETF